MKKPTQANPAKASPPSKNAKPGKPAKSLPAQPVEALGDAAAQTLASLAKDLRELDIYKTVPDELLKKKNDLLRLIRKCLQQKRDGVLADALDLTCEEDGTAFELLTEQVQESAEIVIFRRDDGPDVEVNAFVIPLFVRTAGGLHADQCFQDETAFEHVHHSIQEGGLESAKGRVVLVSHAYHPDEIDGISYSHLNEMVREAFESMTRKKMSAAPAIARSMSGWPENRFAPEDETLELRFLLGFALKTLDDPFYRVPEKEAAADRYFEMRAERFRRWSQDNAPLIRRCLVTDGRPVELDFLYQDLFYGGKAAGIAEYYMLQMMSALQQALAEQGVQAGATTAVIGPTEVADGMVHRVNLYTSEGGALVASFDKPIGVMHELEHEANDVYDALKTIGVESLSLAMKFDADGRPVHARPYQIR
jgi:hypothetical protein